MSRSKPAKTRHTRIASGRGRKRAGPIPSSPVLQRGHQAVPPALLCEIHEQRISLVTALTMLYGVDSALRRAIDDASPLTNADAQEAVRWVDLTEITEMLLGRLLAIFRALEPDVLEEAFAKWADRAQP